ncbi:MAG: single-stranded-DNA-specific exonuclease RecJ, partial [Ruminococcus sp.]|nr:single-stranded-DNA-specific exonuclease RecJ [Ruminococcus sp.]
LVNIYKSIPSNKLYIDSLFIHMQSFNMNYCKLRIALDIFKELRLVEIDVYNQTVKKLLVSGSVNLEDSVLLSKIRKKGEV